MKTLKLYRVSDCIYFLFQLAELERRVVEAETRADDAEGKVIVFLIFATYSLRRIFVAHVPTKAACSYFLSIPFFACY